MAASVMASSAMLQHLSRAATGVGGDTGKKLCRFSSCASMSGGGGGGGSLQLRLKLLPRQQRGSSICPRLSAIVARANDSPLNYQVGMLLVQGLRSGVRSRIQYRTFTSSVQCQRHNRFASTCVQCSKQCSAEKGRPGKGMRPRRKLRLRARLRLLLRYIRRGLLPRRGFSWKPILLAALLTFTCALAATFLRVSAVPPPQDMPYSELIDHIHARTVTSALFEEGTQCLLFNVHPAVEEEPPAQEVVELLPSASVDEVRVVQQVAASNEAGFSGNKLKDYLSTKMAKRKSKWEFSTRRVRNDEAYLLGLMREKGVRYSSAPQTLSASFRSLLITVLSLWIPLSPLMWLLHRQISGNNLSAQKRRSSSRLINFQDVAGIDTAKVELTEIVACLKGTSNYASLGAKLPKGVLLVGPPGTGKTLLARAVAGEAGVPFFAASASEFVEMFVGRGAARIRDLFAEARKNTPSIVFIDELDAVGGRRGRSFNDERDQTLNQLLTEMDGFDSETGVLVLAATNRPEVLDPALTRPGRISRRVNVEAPDFAGRQQVLAVHMRYTPVEGDTSTIRAVVASLTPGFVGADLANVVNEAALLAARHGRAAVTLEDFQEAVDRAKYGVGKRRNLPKAVEKILHRWFKWANKMQAHQTQGGSKEPPGGYRTLPYNG